MPIRAFSQPNEAQFYVSMSRARWAMHVFTDSKVALRDAVTTPSKRLSSWELLNLAEKDRALKAELDRQRAKEQTDQQEKAYERYWDTDAGTVIEGAILKRLRCVERAVRPDLSVLDRGLCMARCAAGVKPRLEEFPKEFPYWWATL